MVCLMITGGEVFAQNLLENFRISQVGKTVRLDFTLAAGITCIDLEIERSSDKIKFDVIGFIPGVCGDPSFQIPYTFSDEDPLVNQIAYYRLFLRANGYSEVYGFQFTDPGKEGIKIFPNPFRNTFEIITNKDNSNDYSLWIYDVNSKYIMMKEGTGNKIIMEEPVYWVNGQYVVIVEYDDGTSFSKVVIKE